MSSEFDERDVIEMIDERIDDILGDRSYGQAGLHAYHAVPELEKLKEEVSDRS